MNPLKAVIAIVDDDPGVLEALDLLLSAYGYETELFGSAGEFVEAMKTTMATCALIDIELGDMTGVELAHHLRESGNSLPIIFMTGNCDLSLQKQALEFRCIALLHKPFPVDQLIKSIVNATRKR